MDKDISMIMANRWGEVYPLGGLGGIPFTGKSGWSALSKHVPANGNIFALYAPHVGISKDGKVGQIHRPGQQKATATCAVGTRAYKALKNAR